MPRVPLIAANWKMNPPPTGAFVADSAYRSIDRVDVVVFAPFVYLKECIDAELIAGGQYGHPEAKGAYTGDISSEMLKELGCTHVLCGHSERRRYHGETDDYVAWQAEAALALGLIPVVCIGETEEERNAGKEKNVIERQMEKLPCDIIIAYEPVWAIGTGKNATAEQAEEMHAFIRSHLHDHDQETTRILYGGSMNAANAEELLSQPNIDGGLIGGASLKPDEFRSMVDVASRKAS